MPVVFKQVLFQCGGQVQRAYQATRFPSHFLSNAISQSLPYLSSSTALNSGLLCLLSVIGSLDVSPCLSKNSAQHRHPHHACHISAPPPPTPPPRTALPLRNVTTQLLLQLACHSALIVSPSETPLSRKLARGCTPRTQGQGPSRCSLALCPVWTRVFPTAALPGWSSSASQP